MTCQKWRLKISYLGKKRNSSDILQYYLKPCIGENTIFGWVGGGVLFLAFPPQLLARYAKVF